jgi:PAS domain S-box-containing protein
MTDMIVVSTPEGRIIFTNRALEQKLGYTAEELKTMHILDIHPADNRNEAAEIFNAMFRGERDSCPLPLISKNGAVIPVETRVWSGRWDGNDCVFGISKDLSVEQEAQQRFERLFRNNPAPMALTTYSDGMISDINDAFEKVLGYSRNDVIGRTSADLNLFIMPEQQSQVIELLQSKGRIVDIELLVRRKDGAILNGLFSAELVISQGRKYILSVMLDITERKQAEKLLVEERQRLSSILEGTNVGTWEWNVQTGETIFNERWAEIIGYTLAELSPVSISTWVQFGHPEDLNMSNEILQKHFKREIPYYEVEARMRHKDGHWIWVLDRGRVSTWTENGEPLMMSGTHQDITTRKQAEEQLEQLNRTLQQRIEDSVAELREKDQVLIQQGRLAAMGEMIGNIAHQWRQPLNALSMLITNLHYSHREGGLTETYMNESSATANRLIQKMSTTINDFRNFFSPDKEMVSFSALHQIKQAVLLVEAAFRSSMVDIVIDVTHDCTLIGYPNEYSQVLLNLLTNAREAIVGTGSLPGLIHIGVRTDNEMGVVTVIDNGGGIPEHLLDKIFEPYFTTKNTGTGIGLYMSKMIIERNMHGLITARNREAGSEFSVSVPLLVEKPE